MLNKLTQYGAAHKKTLLEASTPDDITYRPALMIEDITTDGLDHGIYGIEHSAIAYEDPARLALISQLHSRVTPNSRIEILVFDENNNLQEGFVERPMGFGDRTYCSVRKVDSSDARFTQLFNQYTNTIQTTPLTRDEVAVAELYYDDKMIEYLQNY